MSSRKGALQSRRPKNLPFSAFSWFKAKAKAPPPRLRWPSAGCSALRGSALFAALGSAQERAGSRPAMPARRPPQFSSCAAYSPHVRPASLSELHSEHCLEVVAVNAALKDVVQPRSIGDPTYGPRRRADRRADRKLRIGREVVDSHLALTFSNIVVQPRACAYQH